MFLNISLSCTGAKLDLLLTREREGDRFAACPQHVRKETGPRISCTSGCDMMPKHMFRGGRWLGPLTSGLHAGHYCFFAEAMQQVPHCTMKSSTCRSVQALSSPGYLLQLPKLPPPIPNTSTCHQYNQTLHPSTEKELRVFQITAVFKSFYSFGRGEEVHKLSWTKQLIWSRTLWITG